MINKLTLTVLAVFCFNFIIAQKANHPEIKLSTNSILGSSVSININSNKFIIQQSIGQGSVTGTFFYPKYNIQQGFIHPLLETKKLKTELEPKLFDVQIYPNPFSSILKIEIKEKSLAFVNIEVYNMQGEKVFSETFKNQKEFNLELGFLANSEYLMKVVGKEKLFQCKLVKIR